MNQQSVVITTLLHYCVQVRDTMEYCLRKDAYDVPQFKERKRSVLVEVEQPTPLKSIIDNSGDNGQKLEKDIRAFYAEVYGDDSTILHLAEDGLRVDHNQHLAIYKHVIPIHENVYSMITGIINDAAPKNIDVAEAAKVARCEEEMFRAVSFLTLVGDLNRFFEEYQKARQEANGQETPASRFIGNDIGALLTQINAVKGASKLTDVKYKKMEDAVYFLTEYMTGKRDLPEGKTFPIAMRETMEAIQEYIREAEARFREVYPVLIKELVDQVNGTPEQPAAEEGAPAPAAEPAPSDPQA